MCQLPTTFERKEKFLMQFQRKKGKNRKKKKKRTKEKKVRKKD
jgi:hypothetical protein